MGTQLRRNCFQLAFYTKNNFSHLYRRHFLNAQQRTQIFERKFSTVCALPTSRIDENTCLDEDTVVDEFDEESFYECPTDCPPQTQPLIREIMEETELRSRFHFLQVPKNLSPENWRALLQLERPKRRKYYTYLFWKEKVKEIKRKHAYDRKQLRSTKAATLPKFPKFSTSDVVPYFHTKNSMFGFVFLHKFMKQKEPVRVMKSAIFGPHIIIDCSYESDMTLSSELTSCARQISMLKNDNQESHHPFNIIHCNVNVNGPLFEKVKSKFIQDCLDPVSTFHYTEKNFVDLFPVEKLVYLSPHSDTELETYDHNSIYVVGALVDHIPKVGLSIARAQLSGIKTAKFPLDKYVNWCQGTKCLMLVQVVNIMHDLKEGYSWDEILHKHIRNEKTTYAGPYWRERSTDNLDSGFIRHLQMKHLFYH